MKKHIKMLTTLAIIFPLITFSISAESISSDTKVEQIAIVSQDTEENVINKLQPYADELYYSYEEKSVVCLTYAE